MIPIQELNLFFRRKVNKALDVACGSGESTRELAKISKSVVGCDVSGVMLENLGQHSEINFVIAPAHNLPFKDGEFDFINVPATFSGLLQKEFLLEAKRLLNPAGFFAVYNNSKINLSQQEVLILKNGFKEVHEIIHSLGCLKIYQPFGVRGAIDASE